MEALGKHFGFRFVAHALGDANRSARVERPFHYIERNFIVGRTFADIHDLNTQLAAWCARVNATPKRSLGGASALDLYATEKTAMRPLPLFIPEPYLPCRRSVDVEGYVCLHTNRYSVPEAWIDRELSLHETKDRVRIFDGPRLLCEHVRRAPGARERLTLHEHEREQRWRYRTQGGPPRPEETTLASVSKECAERVEALKKRHGGRATCAVKRLHRIWIEYPSEAVNTAVRRALDHGLFDLERVERLVLRTVAGDYFRLPVEDEELAP